MCHITKNNVISQYNTNFFFCNNLYTNRFGFLIQIQRFYFHKKQAKTNKDILQILNIVENHCIRKCHVTVNVRQYYHINRSEKPPRKPTPVNAGGGFHGYGYGLAWDTPGLPVLFPTSTQPQFDQSWGTSWGSMFERIFYS